jgi:ABC-type multidrug transport system fused ATPase/permease subunit
VEHASRIAVLDGGRVIGLGSHAELTRRSERYRELFYSGAL